MTPPNKSLKGAPRPELNWQEGEDYFEAEELHRTLFEDWCEANLDLAPKWWLELKRHREDMRDCEPDDFIHAPRKGK